MPHRLIACAAAVLVCAAAAVQADEGACGNSSQRRIIKFFEYSGAQVPEAASMFSVFRKVVDEEVFRLNSPAGGRPRPDPLKTEPAPGAQPRSHAVNSILPAAPLQWALTPRLLELLDGRMQPGTKPDTFLIHSDIYVLPAPGATTIQPISEDFMLTPGQHDVARSIHLAATYYALAIDASQNACRVEQVTLLAKAEETLKDVSHRHDSAAQLLMNLVHDQQHALGLP